MHVVETGCMFLLSGVYAGVIFLWRLCMLLVEVFVCEKFSTGLGSCTLFQLLARVLLISIL